MPQSICLLSLIGGFIYNDVNYAKEKKKKMLLQYVKKRSNFQTVFKCSYEPISKMID